MALQVWLPLNGTIINQGVSGLSTSGSPTSWGNGLMGKCAVFAGNQAVATETTHSLDYIDNISWACWVNTAFNNSGDTQQYILSVGRVDYNSFGYGLQCLDSANCRVWFGTSTYDIPIVGGKWTHIVFTKHGNDIKIYLNGVQQVTTTFNGTKPTFSESVGLGVGYFHYSGGNIYRYNGSICDVRIYDNALSPKEVHEIAQGLCCHYPLNDPYATGSINKYSGDNFEGKPSGSSYTVTKLANERGYNYKLSYTGTGNNTWPNFYFPTFSFTAGKTYDYSCKVRCHSKNFNIYFRAAHINNDWVTSTKTITVADNQWHEYHIQIKLDAKYTRSGTEYDTKPLVEFYSDSLATKDTVYTCDFDLKDVCVSECSTAASGSNGSWADNTVYDTSGMGNHGSVTSAYRPVLAGDSPMYDRCYEFPYKSYITGKMPFDGQAASNFTISVWLNQIEGGAYSTWLNSNGYGGSGLWLAVNTEGCAQWGYRSVSPNYVKGGSNIAVNTWHLFTYVYKEGVATWYLDGKKNCSATYADKTIMPAGTFTLGDSYTGSDWNTNFHGKLSDFRIYATALSDTDIAELYNTPVSITSTGTMLTKGELIET
jgi:hypothetical protein